MLTFVMLEQLQSRTPERAIQSVYANQREDTGPLRVHDIGVRDARLLCDIVNADIIVRVE